MSKRIVVKLDSSLESKLGESTIRDEKSLIAACPNFRIDGESLSLNTDSTKIRPEELCAALLQVGNRDTRLMLGFAWLYWDYLILDSLTKTGEFTTAREIKSSSNTFLDSLMHPNAIAIKEKAQREEKVWLDQQESLKPYKQRIILSGDLLDNQQCQNFYNNLHQHCESSAGRSLAAKLDGLSNKFYKAHFQKWLEQKSEPTLACKYFNGEPIVLAKTLLTQYIRFEYASFVYFAMQGYKFFFTDHVDETMKQAMTMVMAFFNAQQPLTKMCILRIAFSIERKLQTEDQDSDSASDSSRHSKRSGSESTGSDISPPEGKSFATDLSTDVVDLKLKLIKLASGDLSVSPQTRMRVIYELIASDARDLSVPPPAVITTTLSNTTSSDANALPNSPNIDAISLASEPNSYMQSRQALPSAGMWNPNTTSSKFRYAYVFGLALGATALLIPIFRG